MKNCSNINIAIDGPAGSGKSTIAYQFCKNHPEFIYVNTGSLFRAYAYFLMSKNIDYNDLSLIQKELINVNVKLNKNDVYLIIDNNEVEISNQIKDNKVALYASNIATQKFVREKVLINEREIAANNNIVMDGRDIGTIVLPNANYKFYLNASIDERAKRRFNELKTLYPHKSFNLQEIKNEIKERDYLDMNREIAPLQKASDAIEINTDSKTIDKCVNEIEEKVFIQKGI